MPSTEQVFPRDASWHNYPSTTLSPRAHGAFAFHWPKPDDEALSACGKSALHDELGTSPEGVHPGARCGRPGCRQRWEQWVKSSS